MIEKRLCGKRIVALVCTIAMLLNLSYYGTVMGATKEPSQFLELTFRDFGINDNTYPCVGGMYHNAETLIGTQISGYVTLNEDLQNTTNAAWLTFGYNGWGGLMLYFQPDGSLHLNTGTTAEKNPTNYVINPANIASMKGNNFCGTRFKLTLSMEAADLDNDQEEDDVLVKLYINDEVAIANPTENDALYGSNGEYYILDAVETHFQGYLITQQIGGEGFCSDITLESIDVADTTPYEIKTLTDFKLFDNMLGDCAENTEDSGSLGIGTLENLLIEGTYNFSNYNNILFFGGIWSGFYIQVNNGNTLLLFYKTDMNAEPVEIGSITETEIGAFVGENLPISVGFRFVNKTSTTADVLVSILIQNEYEYQYRIQGATLTSLTDTLHLYAANGYPMSYSSSVYTKKSVSDFGMKDITTVCDSETYVAEMSSFDHVTVEGYYTFSDEKDSNAVYFGTTWQGFRIDSRGNNTLGFMQIDLADGNNITQKTLGTVSGDEIGLKLTDESIKMQITFCYLNEKDGVADVRVAIVFDDTYRVVYTMKNMHTSVLEGKMFLWANSDETPLTVSVGITPSSNLLEVTPADFGIADGIYEYNSNDLSVAGSLKNFYTNAGELTVQGKILSLNVAFLTSGSNIRVGGNDGMGWNGVEFKRINDTQFQFAPTETSTNLQTNILDIEDMGLTSISEEFNLKLSFEYIEYEGDGNPNDVRFGVWINNSLYKESYIYSLNDANYYGNWFGVYCPEEGTSIQVSSPKRTISSYTTPYILEDFGVKTRIYNQSYINELGTVDSYGKEVAMQMDDVSLSGRVSISKEADMRMFGKGDSDNIWEGYRFYINDSGFLSLGHACVEDLDGDGMEENTVNLDVAFPEIAADEMFDFTITQDILDADADGQKDDVQLGVWVNGKMHENRYYYLLDFSEYIKGSVLLYPAMTGKIEVDSSIDKEVYNLANSTSQNGYLLAGKGTMTVNQVSKKSGDVLKTVGDYIVRSADKGAYVRKIVLYESGDAHPDEVIDVKDLVAIEKVAQNILLDTASGTIASDVDGNGKTDALDCDGIRKHLIGEKAITPIQDNFVSYDEDVMPIGGYYGPYDKTVTDGNYGTNTFDTLNEETFAKIKELGVNLITYTEENYVTNKEDILLQLELAEKYGVDVYVKDTRISSKNCATAHIAACLSEYMEYDSFKGLSIVDEPNTDYYGFDKNSQRPPMSDYVVLSEIINAYCNINGDITLLPKNEQVMYPTTPNTWFSGLEYNIDNAYNQYVEQYLKNCSPKVLSSDFYVFDHLTTGSEWKTIDGYFKNLEVMREKSVEHGVTFWNYIQAGSWFTKQDKPQTDNEVPSEGQMLWNVNTSLAYGAKGILYFPLIQPYYFGHEKTKTQNSQYTYRYDFKRNGLIGADGNETSWYPHAKKANKQIATVDEVLMHTISKDVLAVGTTAQEKTGKSATEEQLKAYGLDSITAINGTIVGVFEYQGKTVFYVVNYDYENSQDIVLDFGKIQNYSVMTDSEQLSEEHTGGMGRTCTLKLKAGCAALVTIN